MDQLKRIQEKELCILKEFIRICEKYGLRYYLVEGSLLGAVRHQGMIPWDDDIDVALFRNDYHRFLQIVQKELPKSFECHNYNFSGQYIDYITQIVDTETLVETPYRRQKEVKHLWIDVFVIDGMPKGKVKIELHKCNLLYRKLMLMWSNLDHFVVNRNNRPIHEKVLIWFGDTFHMDKFLSTEKQLKKMDYCMRRFSTCESEETVNFMSEYRWRTVFPRSYYGQGRMVPFEGFTVRIPERSEEILSSIYGNYNELPPEDKRYKHSFIVLRLSEKDESN